MQTAKQDGKMSLPLKFSGKVAVITGASSGIGAATAVLFSKLGATLALTGRNVTNLESVASKCKDHGIEPLLIKADLNKETEVKQIVEQTVGKFGRIDVLVNNAGIIELGSIENTSLDQYDRLMNTNVRKGKPCLGDVKAGLLPVAGGEELPHPPMYL